MVIATDLLLEHDNSLELEQFYLFTCFIKNKVTEAGKKKKKTPLLTHKGLPSIY